MSRTTRRGVLGLMAAGVVVTAAPASASAATTGTAKPNRRPRPVPIETKSLDRLHQEAIAEGGRLVVFAGGDSPDQSDGLAQGFAQQFPGMQITIKTDLSKYHDARIDNQLSRNRLEPDVAHLQTLQDFDMWK